MLYITLYIKNIMFKNISCLYMNFTKFYIICLQDVINKYLSNIHIIILFNI